MDAPSAKPAVRSAKPVSSTTFVPHPLFENLRAPFQRWIAAVVMVIVGACAKTTPAPEMIPEPVSNATVAPTEQPVPPGDCAEARRRAADKPDLVVDQLPLPVEQKPPAL